MLQTELQPFKNMVDIVEYMRQHQDRLKCPLCNARVDAVVYYGGFDINVSGRLHCKCVSQECGIEFDIAPAR